MTLYHGTTVRVERPRIIRTEIGRDFGCAFYTTDIREQAERWALRKARIESRRRRGRADAVVNVYEWNGDLSGLRYRKFPEASMDWLELVLQCRGNPAFRHGYDIVEGKIADDNVGETVSFVMRGVMRKEDAVERLRFQDINNQIAFCTEKSLRALFFVKSYVLGG